MYQKCFYYIYFYTNLVIVRYMRKQCIPVTDPVENKQSHDKFNKAVTIDDVDRLTHHQYSRNSLLSMTNDWNHFSTFCHSKQVIALPASVTAIRQFLERQSRERKYASLKRMAITIGQIHRFHGHTDPCNHRQVKILMAQFRLNKQGDAKQARSFNRSHLEQLQSQINKECSVKQLRDTALLSVMFECAMKRSELCALTIEQLELDLTNSEPVQVSLHNNHYQLSHSSSVILKQWLLMLPDTTGPVFRRIDRHANIGEGALDASSIYRVFRSLQQTLGVSIQFSGQSARVGAAKELAKQGYELHDIVSFGRWVSPAMPAQYLGKKVLADTERLKFKVIKPWD